VYCRFDRLLHDVTICLVGKYTRLQDSYASVIKALSHAAMACNYKLDLKVCFSTFFIYYIIAPLVPPSAVVLKVVLASYSLNPSCVLCSTYASMRIGTENSSLYCKIWEFWRLIRAVRKLFVESAIFGITNPDLPIYLFNYLFIHS